MDVVIGVGEVANLTALLPWVPPSDIKGFLRRVPEDQSHMRSALCLQHYYRQKDVENRSIRAEIEDDAVKIMLVLRDVSYMEIKKKLFIVGNCSGGAEGRREAVIRQLLNERYNLNLSIESPATKRKTEDEDKDETIKIKIRKKDGALEVVSTIDRRRITSYGEHVRQTIQAPFTVTADNIEPRVQMAPSPPSSPASSGDSTRPNSPAPTIGLEVNNEPTKKNYLEVPQLNRVSVVRPALDHNLMEPSSSKSRSVSPNNICFYEGQKFNLLTYLQYTTRASGKRIRNLIKFMSLDMDKIPAPHDLDFLTKHLKNNIIQIPDSDASDSSSDTDKEDDQESHVNNAIRNRPINKKTPPEATITKEATTEEQSSSSSVTSESAEDVVYPNNEQDDNKYEYETEPEENGASAIDLTHQAKEQDDADEYESEIDEAMDDENEEEHAEDGEGLDDNLDDDFYNQPGPSTEPDRNVDPKLFSRILEVFPDVCRTYARKICDGIPFSEADVNQIINVYLLGKDYPKKAAQPASPVRELDAEMQFEYLKEILPDVDPTFLRRKCDELAGNMEGIKYFIADALERLDELPTMKEYLRKCDELAGNMEGIKYFIADALERLDELPTMKEYLRKQQLSSQQRQYTTEFKVADFVQLFPDPKATFSDPKRKVKMDMESLHYLSICLRNLFDMIPAKFVDEVIDKKKDLASCFKILSRQAKIGANLKTRRKKCFLPDNMQNIPLLQELAYYTHKKDIHAYIKNKKEREKQEKEHAIAAGLIESCGCCFDDEVMPGDTFACDKGCKFCRSCIKRAVEVAMGDGKIVIQCLSHCDAEFGLHALQEVLPPKMFSKLAQKKAVAEVKAAGIEDLENCPFCDFATIPAPEDKLFRCLNPDCMKESCRLCKEPSHVPLKCDEVERDEAVRARTYIEDKMTEALLRKCWKCGTKFFKEEGCNKMTCSCGAMMCYLCRQPVTDYKHFNGLGGDQTHLCPLYSDNIEVNKQNVTKAAESAKKEVDITKLKHDPTAGLGTHFENRKKEIPQPHLEAMRDVAMGQGMLNILQNFPRYPANMNEAFIERAGRAIYGQNADPPVRAELQLIPPNMRVMPRANDNMMNLGLLAPPNPAPGVIPPAYYAAVNQHHQDRMDRAYQREQQQQQRLVQPQQLRQQPQQVQQPQQLQQAQLPQQVERAPPQQVERAPPQQVERAPAQQVQQQPQQYHRTPQQQQQQQWQQRQAIATRHRHNCIHIPEQRAGANDEPLALVAQRPGNVGGRLEAIAHALGRGRNAAVQPREIVIATRNQGRQVFQRLLVMPEARERQAPPDVPAYRAADGPAHQVPPGAHNTPEVRATPRIGDGQAHQIPVCAHNAPEVRTTARIAEGQGHQGMAIRPYDLYPNNGPEVRQRPPDRLAYQPDPVDMPVADGHRHIGQLHHATVHEFPTVGRTGDMHRIGFEPNRHQHAGQDGAQIPQVPAAPRVPNNHELLQDDIREFNQILEQFRGDHPHNNM